MTITITTYKINDSDYQDVDEVTFDKTENGIVVKFGWSYYLHSLETWLCKSDSPIMMVDMGRGYYVKREDLKKIVDQFG